MLLLWSCGHTRYVPVERVRTSYRDIVKHQIDSVHLIDSIYLHTKGDTVYQTRWRTMLRERKIIDTVHILRQDTISKVVEVERRPSFVERVERNTYRLVLLGIAIYLLVQLIRRQLWGKR